MGILVSILDPMLFCFVLGKEVMTLRSCASDVINTNCLPVIPPSYVCWLGSTLASLVDTKWLWQYFSLVIEEEKPLSFLYIMFCVDAKPETNLK